MTRGFSTFNRMGGTAWHVKADNRDLPLMGGMDKWMMN